MEVLTQWIQETQNSGFPLIKELIEFLPNLLGAALLLAIGWFVSGLFKKGTARMGNILNRFLNTMLSRGGLASFTFSKPVIALFSKVVFWAVFLFFVKFAAHALGLEAITDWLDDVVDYLPTFMAGGIIIGAGILFSFLARDLTVTAAESAQLPETKLYGLIAQLATLVSTVVMGLNQIGINVSFLANMIGVTVGALLGSLALAFGLGSKTFVSNLIGSHYLQQQYKPGQRIRMDDLEGIVLEITPSSIVLETEDGRMAIPAKLFNEKTTCLLITEEKNEG